MKKFSLFLTLLALLCITSLHVAYANDSERDPEIVGGGNADLGEYPWMVAIGSPSGGGISQWCGGSLIHAEWVLTAAHCMEGETTNSVRVVVGLHQLSNDLTEGEIRNLSEIIVHPSYNRATLDYDMALLKLSTPSTIDPILPVFADETSLTTAGVMATITGWGNTSEGGFGSNILQEVSVPIVSNTTCNAPASYSGDITIRMLCAGLAEGGQDACQNDSGGPLVVSDGNGGWKQAGVVSWGIGCARPDKYGVYARVSEFETWIESHVGELNNTPTAVAISGAAFASGQTGHTLTLLNILTIVLGVGSIVAYTRLDTHRD